MRRVRLIRASSARRAGQESPASVTPHLDRRILRETGNAAPLKSVRLRKLAVRRARSAPTGGGFGVADPSFDNFAAIWLFTMPVPERVTFVFFAGFPVPLNK